MNAPAVSVLMPVYNAAPFVGDAIRSILKQSVADLELIVVNDGSTDGSLKVIRSHQREDDRLVVLDRPNRGLPASLNEGLTACNGEYIARMDADDLATPHRLLVQREYLRLHPAVGLVGGQVVPFGDHAIEGMNWVHEERHEDIDRHNLERGGGAIMHPTFFARRALYDTLGGYCLDVEQAEDYDFLLRAAELTRLANVPEVVLKYRLHAGQVSEQKRLVQLRGCVHALRDAGRRRGVDVRKGVGRMLKGAAREASDRGEHLAAFKNATAALATLPEWGSVRCVGRTALHAVLRKKGSRSIWGTPKKSKRSAESH